MVFYKRAFIHRSYTKRPSIENTQQNIKIMNKPENCIELSTKSNERLEFLGDGLLELVTKYYLYRRFPKENEGFMTEKKIKIVKNEAIGRIAYEMGLHKWFILSRNAEEKKTRTNLKKLGCLFESFLGAIFLDFNKIKVKDEEAWFEKFFVTTGVGFQMVQKFIENVFEKHINWIELLNTDDNYKNILQVRLQKVFKLTPHYLEINYDMNEGFEMGVFLALNVDIHNCNLNNYVNLSVLKDFKNIQEYYEKNGSLLLLMGVGKHKIKRKAEMLACFNALQILDSSHLEPIIS
jgi:dsRNA-specific ribonuclease